MTKKDHVLIARVIASMQAELPSPLAILLEDRFAAALYADNPAFDSYKFERACRAKAPVP